MRPSYDIVGNANALLNDYAHLYYLQRPWTLAQSSKKRGAMAP